jgi:FkbM family methyltransferase
MTERNIFLYWINKEYKLISILRNLIYLHSTSGKGYKVNLITDQNVKDYIKDLPEYFFKLIPAYQADFVRVNVICEQGGIWLDSDTLVMSSLDSLFDIFEIVDGFFIRQNNELLWNGIFGSKANTPLMLEWKKQMMHALNSKNGQIGWTEIGNQMLEALKISHPSFYNNYKIFDGLFNMYPVNWNKCVDEFLVKPYDNYKSLLREFQPLVVLVNSVYKNVEGKTEAEILQGKMPLNYFLNKSMENAGLRINKLYTGHEIFAYNNNDYISSVINTFSCWEPNISNIFRLLLKNSDTAAVIDIGCNIGYFSLISSKNRKIYSIDGNPKNINMLELSKKLNNVNNITTILNCISDEETYYVPSNQELVDKYKNIGGLAFAKTNDTSCIKSTTIDSLIKQHSISDVAIMKVDIEGGELNALKGAKETLKSTIVKNIIIEISPKFNDDSDEILNILLNNNYDIYNIPHLEAGIVNLDENLLQNIRNEPVKNIQAFVKSIREQTNVLAVKKLEKKYVIITDWIQTYLTLEPFLFCKQLESLGWEIILLSNLNIEKIKQTECTVLCVTYDDFDISLLKCNTIKLIYKIDDLHPFKNIREKCLKYADIVISPYQYLFKTKTINDMYNTLNLESYNIFYSAVNEFYKEIEFNNSPIQKVLTSGAVSDAYPLRKYIQTNINQNQIEILKHPSYNNYTHDTINKAYYKHLNNYLCCFTDSLAYQYVLLKVFEICSVGSCLLVDDLIVEQLNELGFRDGVNCIICNKTNMQEKIDWILDKTNLEKVNKIRKAGMDLVRSKHSTEHRAIQFNSLFTNNSKNKQIFETIYAKNIWNNNDPNVPLSGPGSSLEYTKDISSLLNSFIYNNNCKKILDLGCGDLTWVSKTPFFNDMAIKYTGVDIVESQINNHRSNYPQNTFVCKDLVSYHDIEPASLIIIRDVLFHLTNADILSIFRNIRNKFDFIAITSCKNEENTDNFNQWHFAEKNIHKSPFNRSNYVLHKVQEPEFNRFFYIFSHEQFYQLSK